MNFIQLKKQYFIGLQSILCATSFFITNSLAIDQTTTDKNFTPPFKKIKQLGIRIYLIEDTYGKQCILKYPRSAESAIYDALGAKVGESVGIKINHVEILPPQDVSIIAFDENPNQAKTVHSLVPGDEIKDNTINMIGSLIDRSNLKSLTVHKDLCKIAALDIYLDNFDRHNGNYFYDKKTNHFYAIDMDAILSIPYSEYKIRPNISTIACYFITTLKNQNISQKEQKALMRVNKMLKKLTSVYPPERLCNDRTELAKQAHHTYSQSDQKKFQAIVEHNFQDIKNLQKLLNQFCYIRQRKSISTKILKSIINPSNTAKHYFWQTMNS